ncbi:MAG: dihydroorotase [Nitrospira sp.]|nr:dihydroorotase [Nitrospira sp.]
MVNRLNTEEQPSFLVLAGGWVLDPGRWDGEADVWIKDGVVDAVVSPDVAPPREAACLDVTGLLVLPGLIDLHVHLREPGFEYKETIATGTAAAVAGGFTSICCMPNTKPVNDEPTVTQLIKRKSGEADRAKVYPIGAITKGAAGRELTDFRALKEAGCVALSDDGRPVMNNEVMQQAMKQASDVDLPVIDHCEDLTLSGCGCMNEGPVSRVLGFQGIPTGAEFQMIARDIKLAETTGARLHVAHLSTAVGVDLVRQAKVKGLRVTAEVCPHHFTLTDEAVRERGVNAKMNPPLRSERDRDALLEGLADGTIDAIATDHAPHAEYEKQWGMNRSPFGIVGLETALALTLRLVEQGVLSLKRAVQCLTSKPAGLLGLPGGTLKPGASADIVVVDHTREWVVDPEQFLSKGRNTPFAGWSVRGRVIMTVVGGRIRHWGPRAA